MPDVEGWPAIGLLLGLVALVVVAFYFTATLAGALVGAGAVILLGLLVGYILYVIGGRLHDRFRHGKPIRRDWTSKERDRDGRR